MLKSLNQSNIGVFVLAYKRLIHLKKTLKSINKYLPRKDKIHIFMDTYSKEQDLKTIKSINKVNNYLKNLPKKKYIVIFRKKRFGVKKNWFEAYDYMFKKYKKVICIEDDILIKKNFFEFMYYYLNKYENNKKIMNITGFGTKVKLSRDYNYDCFITKRPMSWGQASWSRVWYNFKKIKMNHLIILKNKFNNRLLISGGEDLLTYMVLDYLKYSNSLQIWWSWHIINNNGFCLNPTKSLVKNIGYDGTGQHSKEGDQLNSSKNIKRNKKKLTEIIFDEKINKNFLKNFEIKKRTYIIFNYMPIWIISILMKIKKHLNI